VSLRVISPCFGGSRALGCLVELGAQLGERLLSWGARECRMHGRQLALELGHLRGAFVLALARRGEFLFNSSQLGAQSVCGGSSGSGVTAGALLCSGKSRAGLLGAGGRGTRRFVKVALCVGRRGEEGGRGW